MHTHTHTHTNTHTCLHLLIRIYLHLGVGAADAGEGGEGGACGEGKFASPRRRDRGVSHSVNGYHRLVGGGGGTWERQSKVLLRALCLTGAMYAAMCYFILLFFAAMCYPCRRCACTPVVYRYLHPACAGMIAAICDVWVMQMLPPVTADLGHT